MYQLLRYFWRLCLLRETPQALTRSMGLFYSLLALNSLVGIGQLLYTDASLSDAIAQLAVVFTVDFALLWMLLYGMGKASRFIQIASTQLGTDAILGGILIVVMYLLQISQVMDLLGLFVLALLAWGISIYGHILRHGLEISLTSGLLIALALFLIRTTVLLSIFDLSQ